MILRIFDFSVRCRYLGSLCRYENKNDFYDIQVVAVSKQRAIKRITKAMKISKKKLVFKGEKLFSNERTAIGY